MRFQNAALRALFHFNMGALFLVLAWLGFMFFTMYRAIPESQDSSAAEIRLMSMNCTCKADPTTSGATAHDTI